MIAKKRIALAAKPFWGGIPSCSKPRGPTGQQTPAAHSHRTARWGLSKWQDET